MENFITTLNSKVKYLYEKMNKKLEGWHSAISLTLVFSAITLGMYPAKYMFWMRCRIAEYAIIAGISLFFLKNWWHKIFMLWILLISAIWIATHKPNLNISTFISFHYVFIFMVAYQIAMDKIKTIDLPKMINGLCVVVLINLAFMYLQYFGLDPFFISHGGPSTIGVPYFVQGTWGHTNFSGAFLALTLPLFYRKKWIWFVPPIIFMLVLNFSLGAILSAGFGTMFYLMFSKLRKTVKVGLIIIVLFSVWVYGTKFDASQFKIDHGRWQYINPTLKMIKARPIVGGGLGQYKIAIAALNPNMKISSAHFEFLELWAETGLIGILPIIGFFLSLFILFIRYHSYIGLLAMTGLVTGLINSCSTFLFHTPMAWILLFFMVVVLKEGFRCYLNTPDKNRRKLLNIMAKPMFLRHFAK